ncbi:MAG: ribosome-binding factor A [Candidatus Lloydbacteria bacterium]|nr:ribosome-binding factor A [Candidatus Lloydbacteria bacterium]
MGRRQEKISELLTQLAATFFRDHAGAHSLITITHASVSSDLARATIYLTVFPETEEERALAFAKRQRSDLREYIKKHTNFRRLPFVDIEIDLGEKNRQHIDELGRADTIK